MRDDKKRLIAVELDEESFARAAPDIEHEREVAIFDLIEENSFSLNGREVGPYRLLLALKERRLVFDIRDAEDAPITMFVLSLTPFRRIVKDYFMICESYYEAIRTASPSQIEAIDMGRRGLHNEGTVILQERLKDKVEMDFDTARRLFTLICVLHWRG